jgi:integrase/recombinase XerD
MERSGYPTATVRLYQLSLERVAVWLSQRHNSVGRLTGDDVPAILREFFLHLLGCRTKTRHRAALHAWLRFLGLPRAFPDESRSAQWRPWVDEYDQFLASNRGLAINTRIYRRRYAKLFLSACFGRGRASWARLTAQDVWRFAERFAAGVKPGSANIMLGALKSLLRYAHLRGVCGPGLVQAVPKVANYGWARLPTVFTERERRRLIDLPPESRRADLRDRAMLLCMLELGLRASDVAQLRLGYFDEKQCALKVFSPKTGEARWLPVPVSVARAIAAYIKRARPTGSGDQLFLRIHPPVFLPATPAVIRCAARRAYARCGFPPAWTGTHRLRHTFATRLYARGASLVEIGGLLGHRCIDSSTRYAHTDLEILRGLAQPWPL